MSDKLNRVAAAKILDVTTAVLQEWVAAGMPYYAGENGVHQDRFVIAEIVKWHMDNVNRGLVEESSMSAVDAKRRREVAQALMAELDLAEKRSELARIDDIMAEVSTALVEVRATIASQSNRLSGLLANLNEDEVRAILDADANDMLEKLSDYDHDGALP